MGVGVKKSDFVSGCPGRNRSGLGLFSRSRRDKVFWFFDKQRAVQRRQELLCGVADEDAREASARDGAEHHDIGLQSFDRFGNGLVRRRDTSVNFQPAAETSSFRSHPR